MRSIIAALLSVASLWVVGCSNSSDEPGATPRATGSGGSENATGGGSADGDPEDSGSGGSASGGSRVDAGDSPAEAGKPPPGDRTVVTQSADGAVFRTSKFTVQPGQERFLCFATNVEEDLVVSGYGHHGHDVLHHIVFSRTTKAEPDGMSECDTLFRVTWEPLYISGAGESGIDFPKDSGHILEKGAQLVAQLHLLNTTSEPITDSIEIQMKRSTAENPRSIGAYAFGTLSLNLPPGVESTAESTCTVPEDVEIIAAFPHMHRTGTALRFETGATTDSLEEVFKRDPYDFDDQRLESLNLKIGKGTVTHVTCNYKNTTDHALTFGESTKSEMCFFISFALDRKGVSGCFGGLSSSVGDPVPVDPDAGVCGDQKPTTGGVGLACNKGGSECPTGLSCTADYGATKGVCFSTGCKASADCGGEFMTCCAPPQGGGSVHICIPESCRSPSCVPVK